MTESNCSGSAPWPVSPRRRRSATKPHHDHARRGDVHRDDRGPESGALRRGARRRSGFGGLIVQGGVTTGLLNAVVAEDLPGPGHRVSETNWKFVKAVRVGETITAPVKVVHVRDDKPICKLETTIRNADGEPCVLGHRDDLHDAAEIASPPRGLFLPGDFRREEHAVQVWRYSAGAPERNSAMCDYSLETWPHGPPLLRIVWSQRDFPARSPVVLPVSTIPRWPYAYARGRSSHSICRRNTNAPGCSGRRRRRGPSPDSGRSIRVWTTCTTTRSNLPTARLYRFRTCARASAPRCCSCQGLRPAIACLRTA